MDKMKYIMKTQLNSAYGLMVTGKKMNPIKRFFMRLYRRFLFKTYKMVYADTDSVKIR